jgi:hypothetical protein
MEKSLFKPPAALCVRSNHNDYGPEAIQFAFRCYPLSKFNRTISLFPAVSRLCSTLTEKVESMGEYGYGR